MYHRVIPADKLIQAGMYVSPATLEWQLVFLKNYFNIVPLNFLTSNNNLDRIKKNAKPPCILTFDDGWKDFYNYAFPLLVRYQQPATVFLPTEFIGSKKQFWTDRFSYLLAHRNRSTLKILSSPDILRIIEYLDVLSGSFDNQLEKGIQYLKKYPLSVIERVLVDLSKIWNINTDVTIRDFLNWQEVAEMKNSGLISFGSHTVNHHILTTLNDEEIKKELNESLHTLCEKNLLDNSCYPFCYPNGNYSKKIIGIVQASGYNLAVTTRNGWNHINSDKFTLKRISIHEDIASNTALFFCRIAGFI